VSTYAMVPNMSSSSELSDVSSGSRSMFSDVSRYGVKLTIGPCHDCRTRGLDGANRCARGAGVGDRLRGGEDRHVPIRAETADGESPIDGHENETCSRAADICSRYQAGRYRRVGEPAE